MMVTMAKANRTTPSMNKTPSTYLDAYSIFQTMGLHFKRENFDAVKYNFKSRSFTEKQLATFKGKYSCAKIVKLYKTREEMILGYASLFVRSKPSIFITEFTHQHPYFDLVWSYVSNEQVLKVAISNLLESPDFAYKVDDGFYFDQLVEDLKGKTVNTLFNLELMCILGVVYPDLYERILKSSGIPPLEQEVRLKLEKYAPIVMLNSCVKQPLKPSISELTNDNPSRT